MTQLDIFSSNVPAHARNVKSKAMQAMAGGLQGGFGNRISLRNSKFRFIQSGSDIGANPEPTLDVVVFAMANNVQRLYYAGAYDPNSKEKPTCFSMDGKTPSDESVQKQSPQCATCPQNVKGSGRQGNTKACAYKKRVVVLSPDDLEGPMYALDVNAMSMFGEQMESKNLYSFKGYYEKLVAHNMDIAAIVTKLSFDDAASVPKLHFSPIRALTAEEFAMVQQRMDDPEVDRVLADMTNEAETEDAPASPPKQVTSRPAPQVQQQPQPVVQEQGVGGLIQDDAPPVRRGFPAGNKAATAPKGNGVQAAPQQAAPAAPGKVINVDLSKLVNFDD